MVGYLGAMWRCRYFWMSLVKIDLRTRYRRSVIGLGWSLLRPILMTVILCLVFRGIFHRTDIAEYAPWLLGGLVLWDYISTATKSGCQCFFQGEQYIRQHPAPIAIYPLRTALGETVHFLLALCVVFGLAWFLRGLPSLPALLSLVPALVLLFLLAWSLALIAGFANVYFQDTQHLTEVGFQILFYATPIIYRLEDLGEGRRLVTLVRYNPLIPFFDLVRDPILYGKVPAPLIFGQAALTVLVAGLAATFVCNRAQKQLIFHL
jgi:ABC-type polysaccharide/polyol phosphate export permease